MDVFGILQHLGTTQHEQVLLPTQFPKCAKFRLFGNYQKVWCSIMATCGSFVQFFNIFFVKQIMHILRTHLLSLSSRPSVWFGGKNSLFYLTPHSLAHLSPWSTMGRFVCETFVPWDVLSVRPSSHGTFCLRTFCLCLMFALNPQ